MIYKIRMYTNSIHDRMCYFKDEKCTMLHREDGPAVEWKDGSEEWYINDVLHREDGPAVIDLLHNRTVFFLKGIKYDEESYWKEIDMMKSKKRFGSFI